MEGVAMPLVPDVSRWIAVCACAGLLGWLGNGTARGQDPAAAPPPDPAAVLGDVQPVPVPLAAPPVVVDDMPARSYLGVIGESIFGDAYAQPSTWHPLSLGSFFTEGWDEPYVASPTGTGGAARGGWISAFDGVFFRAWFVDFAFAENYHHDGTSYVADYRIYIPLNRRFEVRLDVPFVTEVKGGKRNLYNEGFGDLTIAPRVLLSESRDFSQVLAMPIRTPTGSSLEGNGVMSLAPQYQFWANVGGPWIVRGALGVAVPFQSPSTRTSGFASVGFGQYFARADAAFFRDFFWYFVANVNTTLDNRGANETFFAVTPGVRFALTKDHMWHFLAAVDVPTTGPKAFDYQPIFLLLKDY